MSRRLLLDIQACQSVLFRDRGCARYVSSLADALVATGRVGRASMNTQLAPAAGLSERLTSSGLVDWETATSYRRATRTGTAAYYVMSPFENLGSASIVPPYLDVPLVVTLFDLIPLVMRDRYLADAATARAYEQRLDTVRRADLVLALSEHTRRDAIAHLGLDEDKVRVIGAGVDPHFVPPAPDARPFEYASKAIPGLRERFVLCVTGADDNRKNVLGLLAAWSRLGALRHHAQLVVVCTLPDAQRRVWEGAAHDRGIAADEVLFTGYVPEDALVALYQSATLCVAPSLYEGFGLPVAEAAACGAVTIAARASSFTELLPDAALFDPHDPLDMAAVIERSLEDAAWRGALGVEQRSHVSEHTWPAAARRVVDAVDTTLPVAGPRRQSRRRLAVCSPLPPASSGVADYTDRLLRPLAHQADVDAFVEGDIRRDPTDPAALMRVPLGTLGKRFAPAHYDAVVHVIGGSAFHCETTRIAETVPGVVWLHDVRLGGIYITEAARRAGRRSDAARHHVVAEILRQYGSTAPATLLDHWDDNLAYDHFGIGMTRALAARARAVVVNSEVARAMFVADQAPDTRLPPVHVLPFAVPDPPPPVEREPDLVVALGQVNPARLSVTAVDAIAALRRQRPNTRLVFVGPAPLEYAREVERRAAAVAPGAVTLVGEVPAADYRAWVGRASAALQLRAGTRGESAATVADCLAAGTPVATNAAACRPLAGASVAFLDDASPLTAAAALDRLLAAGPQPRLVHPGFADVAAALLEVVASLRD